MQNVVENRNFKVIEPVYAPYAVQASNSKGRVSPEVPCLYRSDFDKDKDRILHSQAFRKLQNTTQVFSPSEGDFLRTRSMHSTEVASIAKTIARQLDLNDTLAETLGYAHDIGHTPFGHLGQDVLNELMSEHGGFEHNLQGLRIVDKLESPYFIREGLNLMFETREGIIKHCSRENAKQIGELGLRFLNGGQPSLEAQVVNWADAIAYIYSDIEDGLRMKVLNKELLFEHLPWYKLEYERLAEEVPNIKTEAVSDARVFKYLSSRLIGKSIHDLVEQSRKNIFTNNLKTIDDVRAMKDKAIKFSEEHLKQHYEHKKFLRQYLYNDPSLLLRREQQAEQLRFVFKALEQNPQWMKGYQPKHPDGKHRQIADYIAGMTDPFVQQEYVRLAGLLDKKSAQAYQKKTYTRR